MKYLAVVLMPAKKDLKFFKLREFLALSCQQIDAIKNKDGNILYQMIGTEQLMEAQEAVHVLNPIVDMDHTPEEQKRLMSTPLTHAIFELADDFDPAKPLNEFVAFVYVLKPEAYPHAVVNQELDEVDARVRLLLKEIDECQDHDVVKEHQKSLNEALHQQEQMNVLLGEMQAQPVKFEGPQFERVYGNHQTKVSAPVTQPPCDGQVSNDNNNNETAEENQRRMAQPKPNVNGFYAQILIRNNVVANEAGCEDKANNNQKNLR